MSELDRWVLQSFVGIHVLSAAVFVGSNVFLDFLLTPRLQMIPPGQAARLGEKLGVDVAILNWVALVGSAASGLVLLFRLQLHRSFARGDFYTSGYGVALLAMIVIWATLVVSAYLLTFYLRPRVVIKLPYGATRQEVEERRSQSMKAATWLRRLANYNAVASIVALLVGGFLRYGGFPF